MAATKKTTKKTTPREKPNTAIQIPSEYKVDIEEFVKAIGYTEDDLLKTDKEDDDFYRSMTHKAIEYTIDSILEQTDCKSKFKKTSGIGKNKIGYVKWEHKAFECYLAIYLSDASLMYTIRLNTVNCEAQTRNVYFYYDKMSFLVEKLVYEIVKDFPEFIRVACNLNYAFENYGYDNIPRRTHKNGSWFCSRREDFLLQEKHFYDGYIDYENGGTKEMYPWDEWTDELYGRK